MHTSVHNSNAFSSIFIFKPKSQTQTSVQSSDVFFNPECTFSCGNDGPNKCDTAIMKLLKANVPEKVQEGALQVCR